MAIQHIRASEIPNDRSAIDRSGFTVAVTRFDPTAGMGRWHHHSEHHVVAYVMGGTLRVESGPSGTIATEASAGDLLYVEPGTIHREDYGEEEFASIGFYFGSGPGRVDVAGPEGAG